MWRATLRAPPTFSLNVSYPRWNIWRPTRCPGASSLRLANDAVREVIHGNYRIVYRVQPDLVEIVTVFHGARLFRLR